MNTYNIANFSSMIGVSVKTLQRWDREGKLVPSRTPSNRRVYTEDDYAKALGLVGRKVERQTVVYARVSSAGQKDDLQNQIAALEQFCISSGIAVDRWIKEVGSGLNFKRKKFLQLVMDVTLGKVDKIVIAHKDRLARFGFDLIKHLCDSYGCEIVVMNVQTLSPQEEMVEDVLAIIHCFSSRLYGLRTYKKQLKEDLQKDA